MEGISLPVARRICAALQMSLPLAPRWRGSDLPRLMDAGHAAIVEAVTQRIVARAWEARPEYTFNWFGERGSVDVLGLLRARLAILIAEIKRELSDLQDTLSTLDRKLRIVPKTIEAELGWRPKIVGVALVLPASTAARVAVDQHAAVFDAAFPARSVAVRRWLEAPADNLRGIWFVRGIADSNGLSKPGPRGGR